MINPKVSIIIPVYNGSNYLGNAIDSALAQTYKNIEILVINDGSNDNGVTEAIAKAYGDKIKYYSKVNGGVATALNLGIEKMTGKYFSWLSHDDMYYPEKIEKQVELIKGLDDTVIISDWTIVNEDKKIIKECVLDDKLEMMPMSFLAFDTNTWLNACAMLIPVSALKKSGGFDESLRTTQDYDMHRKLIKNGINFKILHCPLLYSRVHSEQGCKVDSSAQNSADIIHQKIIQDIPAGEIGKYFDNNREAILSVYRAFETNGYRRSMAYFINAITSDLISKNQEELTTSLSKELLVGSIVEAGDLGDKPFLHNAKDSSSKPRIMFCSGHWLTGGMERVMSNLFPELRDRYDIFLLTPFDGRESCIQLPDYVKHIKISDDFFINNIDVIGLTYSLIYKIDVVIGFMNMFEKQLDFYRLCDNSNIKTIASSHEHYLYPYKSVYYHGIVKKRLDVLKNVSAAIWPTNFSVALYDQYNDNGYVIANPNVSKVINSSNKPKKGQKNILCVGRFNDYVKRVDRMLKCFAEVLKTEPNANLVLVGKYDNNANIGLDDGISVNDLIKKLKIPTERINFVGEVSDVEAYYLEASLILMTSNNEGFGMVLIEAARFGVPAVCNAISGIEDIITDGENGYIVQQDDVKGMASRVCEILQSDELKEELGKNAKKLAGRFDADIIGEKWRYLIDSILSSNSREDLRLTLNKKLAHSITDYKVFSEVLAKELNEVVYSMSNKNSRDNNWSLAVRLKDIPRRFMVSVRNDGAGATLGKIIKKTRKKLFKI